MPLVTCISAWCKRKSKDSVHPIICHEDTEGSRSIAVLFLSLGARWGGWLTPRPGLFSSGNDRIPIA